jgi:hypothetical protein
MPKKAKAKNPAAQSMAKARWKNTTPEQRSAYGTKMAKAKWAKKKGGNDASK